MFACPICKQKMEIKDRSWVCPARHSFDLSRRGYVNLSLTQSARTHGDDKQMVAARADFLNKGYYAPLRDKLCALIDAGPVLDIGCGEGYYLEGISEKLGRDGAVCGVDLSKAAVNHACRRSYASDAHFAVAGCTALPVASGSIGTALSVFAPISEAEVKRVLAPSGRLIRVTAGVRHLMELKQAVYDKPQLNPPTAPPRELTLEYAENLQFKLFIDNGEDIRRLFSMTPYSYRTTDRDKQKLKKLTALTVTAHFYISIYK